MIHLRGFSDRLLRQLPRLRRPALQPQLTRQRDAGPVAVVEAIDRADPLSAGTAPCRLQHLQRVAMLTAEMQRDAEQRLGERERGGIAECFGDDEALLRIAERGLELTDPLVEDVHPAEQLELVRRIAEPFRDGKRPGQRAARGFAAAAREHQGQSERGLEMHLFCAAARGGIDRRQRPLGPPPAFGQQGHRQENGCRRGGERNADADIAGGAKAPVERGAHVVECREMDGALVGARHRRPFGAGLLQPSPVVGGVAGGEGRSVALDREQIGARRVEQAVAHHGADRPRRDHRFGDEAVDGVEQKRAVDLLVGHDLECGVDGEMAGENREPAQHQAFELGQQSVAPVQRGLQRLLPRRRGALTLPEQIETFVKQRCGLLQAIGLDPAGRELDRERHAVELAADARGDRGIGIVERDLGAASLCAFEEELECRIGPGDRGRQFGIIGRNAKRRQPVDLLALDAQRLSARGQDMDLRRGLKNLRCEWCCRRDHMLAIVQHQQHSLVVQMREQGRHRIVGLGRQSEHQQQRGDHEIGIAERGEINEVCGLSECREQIMRDRHRDGGLADAARADDRDEAGCDELVRYGGDRVGASDHPLQSVR